jgi:hypothetical protein
MAHNKVKTMTLEERSISKIEVLYKAKRIENDELPLYEDFPVLNF